MVRVDEVFHGINVNELDNSLQSPPVHLCVVTYIIITECECLHSKERFDWTLRGQEL